MTEAYVRRDAVIMACDYSAIDDVAVAVVAKVHVSGSLEILDVMAADRTVSNAALEGVEDDEA